MTTYTNLNPSFRVFEVDSETHTLLNYQQYRLNLTKANSQKANFLEWELVYDFKKVAKKTYETKKLIVLCNICFM
jgi:sphingomyelin phosphodiesterase